MREALCKSGLLCPFKDAVKISTVKKPTSRPVVESRPQKGDGRSSEGLEGGTASLWGMEGRRGA